MKKIIGILAALFIVFTLSINVDALLTNTSINSIDLAALTTANAFEEEEQQQQPQGYYEVYNDYTYPETLWYPGFGYCTEQISVYETFCEGFGSDDCEYYFYSETDGACAYI